jgi:hypothetical protein
MAGESQILEVTAGDAAGQKPTGKVILVDSSGRSLVVANGARVGGTSMAYYGACTTRATLRAEVGTGGAIGSTYQSSAGKLYLKVAAAGADTDWQRVTTTAAD